MENSAYEKLLARFPEMEKSTEYELELIASEVTQMVVEGINEYELKEVLTNLEIALGIKNYWRVIHPVATSNRIMKTMDEKIGVILGEENNRADNLVNQPQDNNS
ncbi:hypothetical protein J4477_01410 [Candidatus Pacearchaeota archaeon]|nr:hypothetical protein [Candidatus Pacearchaeota archaeon]